MTVRHLLVLSVALVVYLLAVRHAVAHCDGTSGKRVQVIYVQPHGAPDRYESSAGHLRMIALGVDLIFDTSAHKTGGHRHVRFVLDADCQISVAHVRLPEPGGTIPRTYAAQLAALGFDSPDRKHLLFVDAHWPGLCAYATTYPDSRPGADNLSNHAPGWAIMNRSCWDERTAAHELVHLLGGVQMNAPNSSGGWHCTDGHDIMCHSDRPHYPRVDYVCPISHFLLLDCNDDDYFHTNPEPGSYLATQWNVANSLFLSDEERRVYMPMVVQ